MPFLQVLACLCVAASGPAGFFRCPECGEFFFFKVGTFNWNFFPQKCVHCGLPKWAEPSPKPPTALTYPIPRRETPRPDPAIADRLRAAKFLTLILRDDPGAIHLTLDSDGWADVQNLLARANRYGFKLTREDLAAVMNHPEEHRFEGDPSGDRIRWMKSLLASSDCVQPGA